MYFNNNTQTLIDQARGRNISDLVRLSARRKPTKTALVYEGIRHSYAELDEIINRTANALLSLGVKAGDSVALISHNNRAFLLLRFAVARVGAVLAPINFMLNAEDIAYILELSDAHVVLAEDALCNTVDQAIGLANINVALKGYLPHTGSDVPSTWQNVEGWFDHTDATPVRTCVDEDAPTQMMFTSGTESRPKGALLSARALYAQYVSCIVDGEMNEHDIELHSLPLYHCAQLDCFLTPDLYLGATSILLRAPDATVILESIEREGVTKLFCPPTVWIALLRHPDFDKRDLSSLNKGYYGASVMPTAIIEELAERLPNLQLYNFYGQTELAPVATVLKPEDQLRKIGSAGVPAINVETRIVDANECEVPANSVGEIVHRSAQVTNGYFKDDQRTLDAFKDGWFHSGDLGYFDDEGYLYLVDRKKDMIKSGGENVASREVEEQIFKNPEVSEVAVFGVPHDKWIEAVVAVVVLREGSNCTETELQEYCNKHLSSYKRPKHIAIVKALPKNASGKILKRELREQFKDVFDGVG